MRVKSVLRKGSKAKNKSNEDFAYADEGLGLYIVTDGYWGTGKEVSKSAPGQFSRNLEERIEDITPENAQEIFQEVVDKTNEEIRDSNPGEYTTMTVSLVREDYVYSFTLGDSVSKGTIDGKLVLLTEPQTSSYEFQRDRHDNAMEAFDRYCLADNGTSPPKNFLGLPMPPDMMEKPIVKEVTVTLRDQLEQLLLASDGLTGRVMPNETEEILNGEFEEVIPLLVDRWENPVEAVYGILNQIYGAKTTLKKVKAKLSDKLGEYNIKLDIELPDLITELEKNNELFGEIREICLNYKVGDGTKKPKDDLAILHIDLSGRSEIENIRVRSAEYREMTTENQTLRSEVERLTQSNSDLSRQLERKSGETRALTGDLSGKTGEYDKLTTKHEEALSRIKELERIARENKEEYDGLNTKYNGVVSERDRLTEEVQGLETQLSEKGEEVASIGKRLETANTEVSDNGKRIERLKSEIEGYKKQVEENEEEYNRLNTEYEGVVSERDRLTEDIQGLESQLSEKDETITTNTEKLIGLENDIGRKEGKIRKLEEEIRTAQTTSQLSDDEIEELEGKIRAYKKEKGSNEIRYQKLRTINSRLVSEINRIDREKGSLDTELNDKKTRITRLEGNILQTKDYLDRLTNDYNKAYERISELEKTVKKDETRYTELEKRLEEEVENNKEAKRTIEKQKAAYKKLKKSKRKPYGLLGIGIGLLAGLAISITGGYLASKISPTSILGYLNDLYVSVQNDDKETPDYDDVSDNIDLSDDDGITDYIGDDDSAELAGDDDDDDDGTKDVSKPPIETQETRRKVICISDDNFAISDNGTIYLFSEDSNEPDLEKETICNGRTHYLDPNSRILYYYVDPEKTLAVNPGLDPTGVFVINKHAKNEQGDRISLTSIMEDIVITVEYCNRGQRCDEDGGDKHFRTAGKYKDEEIRIDEGHVLTSYKGHRVRVTELRQ